MTKTCLIAAKYPYFDLPRTMQKLYAIGLSKVEVFIIGIICLPIPVRRLVNAAGLHLYPCRPEHHPV